MIIILLGISGYQGGLGERARHFMHRLNPSMSKPLRPLAPDAAVRQPISETAANAVLLKKMTGNSGPSSPSAGKGIQSDNPDSFIHNPKRVVVKNGDTLTGIVSRFFPENVADGVKKTIAINPMIDDNGRIYPDQELIIPETGPNKEDSS